MLKSLSVLSIELNDTVYKVFNHLMDEFRFLLAKNKIIKKNSHIDWFITKMKLILLKTIQYSIDIRSEALGGRGGGDQVSFLDYQCITDFRSNISVVNKICWQNTNRQGDRQFCICKIKNNKKGIKYFIL